MMTKTCCPICDLLHEGMTREEVMLSLGSPDRSGATSRKHKRPLVLVYGERTLHFAPDGRLARVVHPKPSKADVEAVAFALLDEIVRTGGVASIGIGEDAGGRSTLVVYLSKKPRQEIATDFRGHPVQVVRVGKVRPC